jgi:hypothetical protein
MNYNQFTEENRISILQHTINYTRRHSFQQAVKYVELALLTDQPDIVRTVEYALDSYRNLHAIEEQLQPLGIQTDGSTWLTDAKDWQHLGIFDLYKGLSPEAQRKFLKNSDLVEVASKMSKR